MNKLSYKELIYKLSSDEIKDMNDTFIELGLIDSTSKNPERDFRRCLKHKRQNSKGKLRKLYAMMLNGDHLKDGIDTFSKYIIKSKVVKHTGTLPVINDCEFFPSKDYIEHSFGSKLCEHPNNELKECSNSACPKLNS